MQVRARDFLRDGDIFITLLWKYGWNHTLCMLLAKDVIFSWDTSQADAFQKVKDLITKASVLAYYDKENPLTLQCDTSKSGWGCTLLQDGRPIAYETKSFTQSENYTQIEKELFAILCKCFHQYVYKVIVKTDHLLLVSVNKKPLHAAPPRLTRMLLQLQKYDLDITFVWGIDLHIANVLFRNMLKDTYPVLSERHGFTCTHCTV